MQIEELLKKILERLDESNELLKKIYDLNFDAKLLIESNKTGPKYQPYVLYNYVERDFFYTYAYGKWSKHAGNNSEKISVNEPSINLILSN